MSGQAAGSGAGVTCAMVVSVPVEKFRKDYKLPDYFTHSVDLTFKIFSGHTQVVFPIFLLSRSLYSRQLL
jgi:hypothetical protein